MEPTGVIKEPVCDAAFWSERYRLRDGELHRAVFNGSVDQLGASETDQRRQLELAGIKTADSILEVGCGYGRSLPLLPLWWMGDYLGLDLCPEFINEARGSYPTREFHVHDARLPFPPGMIKGRMWDVGLAVWVECMVRDNLGDHEWERIEANLRLHCKRVVSVKYQPGTVPDERRVTRTSRYQRLTTPGR